VKQQKESARSSQKKHPKIDWKNMAGMRDKLIHDYIEVDYEIVCDSAFNDVPELYAQLPELIKSLQ
jgi:uncharacterized protein with HEPN domain